MSASVPPPMAGRARRYGWRMAAAAPRLGSWRDRAVVLSDPRFVAAVAVLAVNDHLVKGQGPGWLTGKLSDAAGVFVVAVLVGVVLRPRVAALLTAVGFAAIKLSAVAAGLAAPLLGGVTRQDPTDLVALVLVVPANRLARRARPGV